MKLHAMLVMQVLFTHELKYTHTDKWIILNELATPRSLGYHVTTLNCNMYIYLLCSLKPYGLELGMSTRPCDHDVLHREIKYQGFISLPHK